MLKLYTEQQDIFGGMGVKVWPLRWQIHLDLYCTDQVWVLLVGYCQWETDWNGNRTGMGNGMECLPVEHDNEPSTLVDERAIATDEAGMEERGQDLAYGG